MLTYLVSEALKKQIPAEIVFTVEVPLVPDVPVRGVVLVAGVEVQLLVPGPGLLMVEARAVEGGIVHTRQQPGVAVVN